jgi:uncharacterized protein YbjT (DUF2867 family)
MIGRAVANQLNKDGFSVRVLTRNAAKARKIFNEDFEIFQADVFNPDSLEKAFKDMQFAFISLPEQNVQTAAENILGQLKNKPLEQIGYISGCTVRKENAVHPMIRAHFEAEKKIMDSGIPWSIFRPTMILDTLPVYANKGKPFVLLQKPHDWNWIHTADMAKMISKAFQTKEARDKKFTFFGPEKHTLTEAIDQFNQEFFPSAKPAKPTPYWISHILALFIGAKMRYAISIFKYFETHPQEGDPAEAYEMLGKPQIGLKEFFKLYRENTSVQ